MPRWPQVVKFVIVLYLGLTPFAYCDSLGWLTPAGAFILSLLFLAVDEIGAEIEDPFGALACGGYAHAHTHALLAGCRCCCSGGGWTDTPRRREATHNSRL